MPLWFKHAVLEVGGRFFYVTLLVISLIWLSQSLLMMEGVVSKGGLISYAALLMVAYYSIPQTIFLFLPITAAIASAVSMMQLWRSGTFSILESFGLSRRMVVLPHLSVALVVSMFHYYVSLEMLQQANSSIRGAEGRVNPAGSLAQKLATSGFFIPLAPGVTLYSARFDPIRGGYEDISLYDLRNPSDSRMMRSNSAFFYGDGTAAQIRLYQGNLRGIDLSCGESDIGLSRIPGQRKSPPPASVPTLAMEFSEYVVELGNMEFGDGWEEALKLRLRSGNLPINALAKLTARSADARATLVHRLLWPAYSFVITLLLAAVFCNERLTPQSRAERYWRAGIIYRVGITIAVLPMYFLLHGYGKMRELGIISTIGMQILPLIILMMYHRIASGSHRSNR